MADSKQTMHSGSVRNSLRGEPYVWFTATALSAVTLFAVAFILIIMVNALGFFWPGTVYKFELDHGDVVMGTIAETEVFEEKTRYRIKVGNRDIYPSDFRWIESSSIEQQSRPEGVVALERLEYGNFYGFLDHDMNWQEFQSRLQDIEPELKGIESLQAQLTELNRQAEQMRKELSQLEYQYRRDQAQAAAVAEVNAKIAVKDEAFETLQQQLMAKEQALREQAIIVRDVNDRTVQIELATIVRAWQPNDMSTLAKIKHYAGKAVELLVEEPRESNTEGGVFPAIFGTVMMVFIMSLFALPFGVVAAIYMSEYARPGRLVQLVRISVNNLAGVPSIVYGVFGLGFFIYTVGGAIDELFFPHALPTPTFGTGGILWASLTLALLTVPVVIVSTEEALAAIPKEIREGSLGLGATKFQTLLRVLLPMSVPGILTGLILSMARAAGEVAPLMLTGAVKLAPQLPLDQTFPFLHLDRKFMHLGFHIYDLGFQSPNVEAVLPMVYVTTMLLLTIVIVLSTAAIWLRNRMRRKYTTGVF